MRVGVCGMEFPGHCREHGSWSLHGPGTGAGPGSLAGRRSHGSRAGEEGVSPKAPSPARPQRPSASASRRRKCCVAHFRVLSGRRRRASPVSRPPLPSPRVPEAGATSPPWPASKVGLGRWAARGLRGRPERGGGVPRRPRTPPPGAGRAPRGRCAGGRALTPDPNPRPAPSEPRWARRPRGKDGGVGGLSASPHFLLSSAASLPLVAPRTENEVARGVFGVPQPLGPSHMFCRSLRPRARRAEGGFEGVARDASYGKSVSFPI